MDEESSKVIWWLGETAGFWIQTGAFLLSALAAVLVILHNGSLAKKRALVDLIIQQKSDADLNECIRKVYELAEKGNHISQLVGKDSPNRRSVLKALNNHEFIAVGIRLKAFDEKVYKQLQYNNVVKMWSVTSGFVYELRKMDGKQTLFQDFETLAERWVRKPLKKI